MAERPPRLSRTPAAGLAALSAGITLLIYYRAVTLPVYHDDIFNVHIAYDLSWAEVLFAARILQWYRPLTLAIWKLLIPLAGVSPGPFFHTLLLALHAANGFLIGLLARRGLPYSRLLPWLAVLIYTAFPFSYQAVGWASAMVHPMVTFGTLIAALCLDRWWFSQQKIHLLLAWLGIVWSTFSHENGVVSGLLAAGWLIMIRLGGSPRAAWEHRKRLVAALGPAFLINLAYFAVWLLLPKAGPGIDFRPLEVGYNFLYLLQGLAYPLAQTGGLLLRTGLPPALIAGLLVAAGLAVLLVLGRRSHRGIVGLGIFWYVLAVLPAALSLPWWIYVIHSPRLMLTPSVGAALAWAGAFDALWGRTRGAARVAAAGAGCVALAAGGVYAARQMALHSLIAPVY